jgi:hypothetical protein
MARIVKILQITPTISEDATHGGAKYTVWPNMHYPNLDFSFVAHKHDLAKPYEDGADLRTICMVAGEEADVNNWIAGEGGSMVNHISQTEANTLGGDTLMPDRYVDDPDNPGEQIHVDAFNTNQILDVDSRFPAAQLVNPS